MSQDAISRYKRSFRLRFQNPETEARYRDLQRNRGRSSSSFAFAMLFVLCAVFAYLEFRAFGREVAIPMYGYLFAAALALVNLLLCRFVEGFRYYQFRLLGNGVIAMATVVVAAYLQKYGAYHALEFVLLAVWLGSLKPVRTLYTLGVNAVLAVAFVAVLYLTEISAFRMILASELLATAVLLAAYIGYLGERGRRMLFLETEINKSMTHRQELWAFTLIDLDMALSGILEFKELIGLLKRHLEPVIEFESYILTSLEGQGPKPTADKIEGALFEDDDSTLWSEELLGKLTQTRQATVSAEHETVKGFLGIKKQRFTSYRLDIPVFNDSRLMGVISLRRASEPFDELDKIAGVSIASQAMLIYKRSARGSGGVVDKPTSDPVIRPKASSDTTTTIASENRDLEVTDHSFAASDQTLVPKEVMQKIKQSEETAKRTITLMSRENADKIAIDRYRMAAVEGEPLSMLIIEVDGLSRLREQDGDQVAYKVFAAIVKYIFSKVDKDKDILGRYGQNGLSVLMPGVDMNAAEKFAEMIRQFVEGARYRTPSGEKSATLSVGVAAITDDTGDYASMVKRADMALFVAKKNGRNCVKVRL